MSWGILDTVNGVWLALPPMNEEEAKNLAAMYCAKWKTSYYQARRREEKS
jgi:hypothetical protein